MIDVDETVNVMVAEALERKREYLVSAQGLLALALLYVGIRIANAVSMGLRGLSDSSSEGLRNIGTQIKYRH